jgi:hypothetical protein
LVAAPAFSSIPGFLYIIVVNDYVPSLGGALAQSLLWAWNTILTLPFLTLWAYAAAAWGRGALFTAIVATCALLGPVVETKSSYIFVLASAGVVMSTLSQVDQTATSADPAAFVTSLWAPHGALTIQLYLAILLVPFAVIPQLIGKLILSSR